MEKPSAGLGLQQGYCHLNLPERQLGDEYIQATQISTGDYLYAVWLYHRFNLSHRDIEDLLAERGIAVSHESIWLWCIKFGPKYARHLVSANHYRSLRISAFSEWSRAVA